MTLLRLTPQVARLYQGQIHIEPTEQYISSKTMEETLNQPTTTICNWIFKATNQIRRAKLRQRQQKKKHLPIHSFFTRPFVRSPTTSKTINKTHSNKHPRTGTQAKKNTKTHKITTLTKFFPILCKRPKIAAKDDLFPP
jgi:hypothetical protein